MDVDTFLTYVHVRLQAVFVLTYDLTVTTYHWTSSSPTNNSPIDIVIPRGTEVYLCGSGERYTDGHAMSALRPTKAYGSAIPRHQLGNRWFKVKYSEMEYIGHRIMPTSVGVNILN